MDPASDDAAGRDSPRDIRTVSTSAFCAVIDSVLPFADIVDAHRRVDSGHKSAASC
jgi:hypothetical protein